MNEASGTVSGHNRFSIRCHSTIHQGQGWHTATQKVRLHLLFTVCELSAPATHLHPSLHEGADCPPQPTLQDGAECQLQALGFLWLGSRLLLLLFKCFAAGKPQASPRRDINKGNNLAIRKFRLVCPPQSALARCKTALARECRGGREASRVLRFWVRYLLFSRLRMEWGMGVGNVPPLKMAWEGCGAGHPQEGA